MDLSDVNINTKDESDVHIDAPLHYIKPLPLFDHEIEQNERDHNVLAKGDNCKGDKKESLKDTHQHHLSRIKEYNAFFGISSNDTIPKGYLKDDYLHIYFKDLRDRGIDVR